MSMRSSEPSSSLPLASLAPHLPRSIPQQSRKSQRSQLFRNGVQVSLACSSYVEDSAYRTEPVPAPRAHDDYDNISAQLNDDESIADDTTVASASFMLEDDRYDM